MILFALKCGSGHEFEGWFKNGDTYDAQSAAGEIACPTCGDTKVDKAVMAPRLAKSKPEPVSAQQVLPPAKLRHMLQEIRRHVEANCDYVGDRFAEEARRIHKGETEERGIYGEATPEESKELADEGIEVASIPWVPPNDA